MKNILCANKHEDNTSVKVVGISTDSHFSHLAWVSQPRKQGGLGGLNYPLVSDFNKQISRWKQIHWKHIILIFIVICLKNATNCIIQGLWCSDWGGWYCPERSFHCWSLRGAQVLFPFSISNELIFNHARDVCNNVFMHQANVNQRLACRQKCGWDSSSDQGFPVCGEEWGGSLL